MSVFTENQYLDFISKTVKYTYLVDDPEKIDKGQICVLAPHKSSSTELPNWEFFLAFPKQGKQQNGTPKMDIRAFDILPN